MGAVNAATGTISPASNVKDADRQEYEAIRAAFVRMVFDAKTSAESLEMLEDIITLRASFLVDRALQGLRIDLDRALDILRNYNDFTTERERQQRDILVAAVDNLVDFAVAEEYAMIQELPEEPDESEAEEYEAICERYNLTYAREENSTVLFAAGMAAWWLAVDAGTVITFMTQGDERVRPWHEAWEGASYPKREFPVELIPPLEWGCRCFLIADGFGSVYGALSSNESMRKPDANPIFSESLAVGGRVFTEAHPYFRYKIPGRVQEIGKRIKLKFDLHGKNNIG